MQFSLANSIPGLTLVVSALGVAFGTTLTMFTDNPLASLSAAFGMCVAGGVLVLLSNATANKKEAAA